MTGIRSAACRKSARSREISSSRLRSISSFSFIVDCFFNGIGELTISNRQRVPTLASRISVWQSCKYSIAASSSTSRSCALDATCPFFSANICTQRVLPIFNRYKTAAARRTFSFGRGPEKNDRPHLRPLRDH